MPDLAGTGGLLRLAVRLDRRAMLTWVGVLGAMPAAVASAFEGLYPTDQAVRSAAGAIAANRALTAFFGPVLDVSVGGLTAWRIGSVGATFTALFSLLTVVRHTRGEEETGRRELLGSAVVGRQAYLASALLTAASGTAAIAVVAAGGLAAVGQPMPGAVAFGLSFAMTGWIFAGVGAVAAQLTAAARHARMIAIAVLVAAFVVRVIADASAASAWAVWVTPLGWAQRLAPFAGEAWWVIGLAVVAAAATGALAWWLSTIRDAGAGLFATGGGPEAAAAAFDTPLALAVRLERGVLAAWTVGLVVFGILVGSITPGLAELVEESGPMREILQRLGGVQVLEDSFLAGVIGMYGLAVAAYAIQAALRLRIEEVDLRGELVLATATSRSQWIASHLAMAVIGPILLMLAVGVATGVSYGLGSGDLPGQLPRLVGAALVQVPAVWVMTAVALAFFGWFPHRVELSWSLLASAVILTLVGAVLPLGQWVLDLSPFTHVPALPGGPFTALPLATLTFVAAVIGAVGWAGALRRDIG